MSAPTFLDVFSGIGGFTLGLTRAGWRCVGHVEIDPFCTKVLERHWPHVRNHGDVRTFHPPAIGSVDLVCAGWPCQDHSVAGRRAGLAGARSGLFRELVRLVRELRPRWLLLENVPGLLSSRGGRDFTSVLAALGDAGYGVGWRVLDARWFGVPQRRRRVFLVGRLGAPCPPEVLFEPEGLPGHPPPGREAGADVAGSLAGVSPGGGWRVGADEAAARQLVAAPVAYALRTNQTQANGPNVWEEGTEALQAGEAAPAVVYTCKDAGQDAGEEAPTLRAMGHDQSHANGGGQVAVAYTVHAAESCAKARHAYESETARSLDTTGGFASNQGGTVVAFNHIQDPVSSPSVGTMLGEEGQAVVAGALTANRGPHGHEGFAGSGAVESGHVVPSGAAVRRLTPTECERLMAFEDGWTCLCGVEPYSTWACRCADGPRYGALGNSVVVNVVSWLGRRLLEAHTRLSPPYGACGVR